MSFLDARSSLARPRRDRDSGADPPDSARAEARHRVSVADVRAADSVSVGAAAAHPPLGAAADARGGDRADRRGVRAAVLRARAPLAAAVGGGAREIVILLDQSASMGYGDHWQQAQDAARTGDRRRWAPTIAPRSCCSAATRKRTCARRPIARRLEAAIDAAKVGSGATRYGPALKLAESILGRSPLKRREAVLDQRLPEARLDRLRGRALPRGHDRDAGVGRVADTRQHRRCRRSTFARASFSGQERITVTAGVAQQGRRSRSTDVPVTLDDRRPRNRRPRRPRVARATRRPRCRSRSSRSPTPNVRGIGARRHRSAAGRQHLQLRARAERAGVAARSSTAATARRSSLFLSQGAVDRHARRRFRSTSMPVGARDAGAARQARGRRS